MRRHGRECIDAGTGTGICAGGCAGLRVMLVHAVIYDTRVMRCSVRYSVYIVGKVGCLVASLPGCFGRTVQQLELDIEISLQLPLLLPTAIHLSLHQ